MMPNTLKEKIEQNYRNAAPNVAYIRAKKLDNEPVSPNKIIGGLANLALDLREPSFYFGAGNLNDGKESVEKRNSDGFIFDTVSAVYHTRNTTMIVGKIRDGEKQYFGFEFAVLSNTNLENAVELLMKKLSPEKGSSQQMWEFSKVGKAHSSEFRYK